MKLQELKEKLDQITTDRSEKNVPVTICDLGDDSDECFTFRNVKDLSVVKIGNKEIVALYFDK